MIIAIPVIVLIGVILILAGFFLFFQSQSSSSLFLGLTICSLPDKLVTFTDPNRMIKEYFCHDA